MVVPLMNLKERLINLAKRREMEGVYTDRNIVENAAEYIEYLEKKLSHKEKILVACTHYRQLLQREVEWISDPVTKNNISYLLKQMNI